MIIFARQPPDSLLTASWQPPDSHSKNFVGFYFWEFLCVFWFVNSRKCVWEKNVFLLTACWQPDSILTATGRGCSPSDDSLLTACWQPDSILTARGVHPLLFGLRVVLLLPFEQWDDFENRLPQVNPSQCESHAFSVEKLAKIGQVQWPIISVFFLIWNNIFTSSSSQSLLMPPSTIIQLPMPLSKPDRWFSSGPSSIAESNRHVRIS